MKRLGTVASNPELYPEFVSLGPIPSLLQLVTHENPDISYDVVKVLSDLTDPETTSEDAVSAILILLPYIPSRQSQLFASVPGNLKFIWRARVG